MITLYLDELAQQRRLSPHTVSNYRRDLEVLVRLIGEAALSLQTLQTHHVRRFIAQLHGRGLCGRSLARTLSAWRGFYRWLMYRGEVPANPLDGVRAPKSPKPLPRALSVDEANRLLDVAGDSAPELRDQAMFDIALLGGDTVKTPGPASFSATMMGWTPKGRTVGRAGARPGDVVMVTGSIGDGWLGLQAA